MTIMENMKRKPHRKSLTGPRYAPIHRRLFDRIRIGEPHECWPFVGGHVSALGRANILWNRRRWLAYRAVWVLVNGPIPDGLLVLHSCDNPPCCNPDHLHLGTCADNSREMKERGRASRGSEHTHAKLTEADVLAIRASPLTERELAKHYGCSAGTIGDAKRRLTWAHV